MVYVYIFYTAGLNRANRLPRQLAEPRFAFELDKHIKMDTFKTFSGDTYERKNNRVCV